jgi:RsiW-degrading membrane proteinase PrsW (M82 family)
MQIYIHHDGKTLGPFDEAGVIADVLSNRFTPFTMACPVGDTRWQPLNQVINLPAECAAPPPPPKANATPMSTAGDMLKGMAAKISNFVGVEHLERESAKGMFSEVWKKRSSSEIEAYFSVGTATSTPILAEIDTRWPRPWAFFKAFLGSIIAFAGLYYTVSHFSNPFGVPAVLMTGAFAVPCSVLVLFYEFNAPRNFSIYQLLRLTLLGGVLSMVVCLFFFNYASGVGLDWMGASVAGIAEEPAKLLAMLIVVKEARYRWTLNGLLIGACVGTGFAVIETAGYAFVSFMGDLQSGGATTEGTLFVRGLLYPLGGHAILSAIVGAALWRVKGNKPFEWAMLQQPRFLKLAAVSVVLHALWNSPLELPFFAEKFAIGVVAWLIILSLVQTGLREIRSARELEGDVIIIGQPESAPV